LGYTKTSILTICLTAIIRELMGIEIGDKP